MASQRSIAVDVQNILPRGFRQAGRLQIAQVFRLLLHAVGNGDSNELLVLHSLGPEVSRAGHPPLESEDDMFRVGEQTNETTMEARASVNVKGMTTVLGGGLLLVIVAFSLIVLLT